VSWRGKFPILYLQIKICISWDYFVFKVIGGCISGRDELVSKVRIYHHVVGGVLNPVSWIAAISKCFLNLFAFTRVAYKFFCQISSYIMCNFWLPCINQPDILVPIQQITLKVKVCAQLITVASYYI
jgi:hypothetical protein